MSDQQNKKPAFFIVTYEVDGLENPFGWDEECSGALAGNARPVALFGSRQAARRAIDISAKFAQLCKAQGKPANDDFFTANRKNVKIQPCEAIL